MENTKKKKNVILFVITCGNNSSCELSTFQGTEVTMHNIFNDDLELGYTIDIHVICMHHPTGDRQIICIIKYNGCMMS